jgi:putative SOS response-associated peptidase YedK
MCAQFVLKTKANELSKKLGIKIPQPLKDWDLRVRGFIKTDLAPVIVEKDGEIQVREMAFSLCPSWSKEFPCKWSTYNARMERENEKSPNKLEFIYEIPTWKESFNSGRTCLVPMNAAIESSYFGTQAGNMIQLKVEEDELFFVVGLWSEWVDKSTGEVKETFTLITDDPYKFFYECGHDRSVFVINQSKMNDWLTNKTFTPKQRFDFLRANRISLKWDVSVDRAMAKGWQKRAPTEDEVSSIKIWTA